jgi:hypothetical protein
MKLPDGSPTDRNPRFDLQTVWDERVIALLSSTEDHALSEADTSQLGGTNRSGRSTNDHFGHGD